MSFIPVGSILGKVLKQCRLTDDLDAYKVFTVWEDIVGSKIAIHARPSKIKGKILYVEVDDPLWHAQIKYMKRDIIGRLETFIKKGVFQDVKFYLR
ncbi:MAG TPA: DUF721 domain-containing protein [Syntrophorhabdaceae bacterium]|nr:DUF721 domain-containing protein [Syntrophorhabdaceae bacterium]HQE79797.1 DUF721 domain-containing protein [Syntrophorhabdaceae bacterium]HQK46389.1 DUF721 domain-containing protein [Syntrophorhabdaceae bacterium]